MENSKLYTLEVKKSKSSAIMKIGIFLVILLVVGIMTPSIMNINEKRKELANKQAEVTAVENELGDVEYDIENIDEYILGKARSAYNFGYPDETIFHIS